MADMPSSEFRRAYPRLREATVVTVDGRPIGTWVPAVVDLGTWAPVTAEAAVPVQDSRQQAARPPAGPRPPRTAATAGDPLTVAEEPVRRTPAEDPVLAARRRRSWVDRVTQATVTKRERAR